MRVIEIGAFARAVSADDYRAQLEQWSREAEDAGDDDEVMSAGQIDAEVARVGAMASVAVEEFAVLADGRRVMTDERHGSCGISLVGGVVAVPQGTSTEKLPDLDPTRQWLESAICDALDHGQDEFKWSRLIAALREHGIHVREAELDSLPFTIEIHGDLLATLAT